MATWLWFYGLLQRQATGTTPGFSRNTLCGFTTVKLPLFTFLYNPPFYRKYCNFFTVQPHHSGDIASIFVYVIPLALGDNVYHNTGNGYCRITGLFNIARHNSLFENMQFICFFAMTGLPEFQRIETRGQFIPAQLFCIGCFRDRFA